MKILRYVEVLSCETIDANSYTELDDGCLLIEVIYGPNDWRKEEVEG